MGLPVSIRFREFDSNGDPLSGGKLYTYKAGTTTKKATYTDPACTVPNTNPVILDAAGYADVWIPSGSYKFRLDSALDVTQWTRDNITGGVVSGGGSGESSGYSSMVAYAIPDSQTATDLVGETLDLSLYSSAEYLCEIRRGTTVAVNGPFAIQNLNGTGRVLLGSLMTEEYHGVTLSLTQVGTVVQLQAAVEAGLGAGTIKLSRRLVLA